MKSNLEPQFWSNVFNHHVPNFNGPTFEYQLRGATRLPNPFAWSGDPFQVLVPGQWDEWPGHPGHPGIHGFGVRSLHSGGPVETRIFHNSRQSLQHLQPLIVLLYTIYIYNIHHQFPSISNFHHSLSLVSRNPLWFPSKSPSPRWHSWRAGRECSFWRQAQREPLARHFHQELQAPGDKVVPMNYRYGGFRTGGSPPIAGWFIMADPIKMDDLGVPSFWHSSISTMSNRNYKPT